MFASFIQGIKEKNLRPKNVYRSFIILVIDLNFDYEHKDSVVGTVLMVLFTIFHIFQELSQMEERSLKFKIVNRVQKNQ